MDSSFRVEVDHIVTSTPKKKPLECQYCGKTYVVNHYFQKHVQSHLNQGNNNNTQSANNNQSVSYLHLDASDLSFSADQDCIQTQGGFKKPAPPPQKKKAAKVQRKKTFVCTYCLKGYVAEKTMRTHMRIHIMQVAAVRFPDTKEIVAHAEEIGQKALVKVANCPSYGPTGQLFKQLVGHVTCINNFCDFSTKILKEIVTVIETKKCLLPSALLKALSDQVENILSNEKFCDECLTVLKVSDFDCDIQSQFILEFILNFLTEIFKFISESFRKHYQRPLKPMPDLDIEDEQVIYYVGGSIMRGYIRIAYRHKSNTKWQKVYEVLKSRVLSSEPVKELVADWTRDVDRGSLLYINMLCHKFFVSVFKVVCENEEKDGSIDYVKIIGIVSKTDISVQWDNIMKDALPEELSVGLMTDVVQCFSKTCGRGIAKRLLNAIRDKPLISMPTRHAVASRKT